MRCGAKMVYRRREMSEVEKKKKLNALRRKARGKQGHGGRSTEDTERFAVRLGADFYGSTY
jgi:hypothetical protein